ncbi:DUF1798 domain-containing protein [Macrococcoides canis]|uniref:DUF1798 family protein n=1 Tax=Macrococcoides canis TaxID=1855823 RepID=A0A1W7ABX8_9STAP|nr:DUF1798 family protein [Macrococcus canis]ARQ06926.1 hypothetical protein MCCS_12830 [Macrococcus canis]UTG99089.1 DUF1798 family protein [Macrococcus canis]
MLQQCIKSLMNDIIRIEQYFEASKEGQQFNFVMDIQPFTETVDQHLTVLENNRAQVIGLPLMNEKKYELMIAHIKDLSVSCFFSKTSKKVFIDQLKAVKHELHYLNRMINT